MKNSIILTILVLAVAVVTVACGSVPAKNEGAVVEKSELVTQEQTTADKSVELSEKDKQVSEKDLEYLINLIESNPEIEVIFNGILNNDFTESLSDPRIDEAFKKARSLMEEVFTKIAELPSVVDIKGGKVRKEYFVYISELYSINLEELDKYLKFLREIEQVLNDLNYNINNDKNKNFIEELSIILNHWIWKQQEEKGEELIKKIEEKYGVKREDFMKFFILEERPEEKKEMECNDKKAPEEKKEDPNTLTDEEKNQLLWREDEFLRMLEKKLEDYKKEQEKENDEKKVPEKTEE